MVVLACIGKSLAVSFGVLVAYLLVGGSLLAAGVPPILLTLLVAVGMAVFAHHFAQEQWDSEKAWAWALAGALVGLLTFPFLWYCRERERAAERERDQQALRERLQLPVARPVAQEPAR